MRVGNTRSERPPISPNEVSTEIEKAAILDLASGGSGPHRGRGEAVGWPLERVARRAARAAIRGGLYGKKLFRFASFFGRYSSITKLSPHFASACCSARTPIFSICSIALIQGL